MKLYPRNTHFSQLVDGLREGDIRHGLSDGTWSLIDGLRAVAEVTGPAATLTLATWTASGEHGQQLLSFIRSDLLREIRLIVDRSFQTRQPAACAAIRELYGDQAMRVWSCHAKFAYFIGGRLPVLVLSSANLNRNARIENFSIFAAPDMVAHYAAMVDELWAMQGDGEGFSTPTAGRRDTARLFPAQPAFDEGFPSFDEGFPAFDDGFPAIEESFDF